MDKSKLTSAQRLERGNIRNGYLAATAEELATGIGQFQDKGNWFAVACLFELQLSE